jgi:glutamyl/glutaminyl-tRNA synthetase
LSKRAGALSLGELETGGAAPERVVGLLAASLGWLESARPVSASSLLTEVDPAVLTSASAEPASLTRLDLDSLTRD